MVNMRIPGHLPKLFSDSSSLFRLVIVGSGLPPGSPFRVGESGGGQPVALLAPSSERREQRSVFLFGKLRQFTVLHLGLRATASGGWPRNTPAGVVLSPQRPFAFVGSPFVGSYTQKGIVTTTRRRKRTQEQQPPHRVASDARNASFSTPISFVTCITCVTGRKRTMQQCNGPPWSSSRLQS